MVSPVTNGAWSMPLLREDAERGGPVEGSGNALNNSCTLSLSFWWHFARNEYMLILPKRIIALLMTHLYAAAIFLYFFVYLIFL